jgi:hypothetical protein
VAKIKAIVASVLIAATAVAAGEVASKVRPIDLRLQGPNAPRFRSHWPRLPQRVRCHAVLPVPTSPAVNVADKLPRRRAECMAPSHPSFSIRRGCADWGQHPE